MYAEFYFVNISTAVDGGILTTDELIEDGDTVVIINDAGDAVEISLDYVSGSGPYSTDISAFFGPTFVPTIAFRTKFSVSVNNESMTRSMLEYFYDPLDNANIIVAYVDYEDHSILTPSTDIVTRIYLSSTGNRMVEMSFDAIYG